MAGKHKLSLDIPPVSNEGVLVISDTSIYDTLLAIDCPTLQILYPGGTTPVLIDVQPGFRAVLNACALGIVGATECTDNCPCLPDGIYDIRYSVSPHDRVFVEYASMRVTRTRNKRLELMCRLDLQCCLPGAEMEQALVDLYIIAGFIDTAVASVENCHEFQEGTNLLKFANTLLNKMAFKKPRC